MEPFTQKLQHFLATEDTEPLVLVLSLVVGAAGIGVILMGLRKLFAVMVACLLARGRKIPDWACPRRAQFFSVRELAPDTEAFLSAHRIQLTTICDDYFLSLRTSLEEKMDAMWGDLHGKFGKLHGELDNLKDGLHSVLERVQGISARVQGLMNDVGRVTDLVQDGQGTMTEVQGHVCEMKASLGVLCADTKKILAGLSDFSGTVANSFQDMGVFQQEHAKRFESWHQNLQQWREKVQQVLERISDRCEPQCMQNSLSQSLMSDARLHAVNTSLVAILNHLGLAVNPKMVPATPAKPKEPQPTPQKQPPGPQPSTGAPGLKANLAAARTLASADKSDKEKQEESSKTSKTDKSEKTDVKTDQKATISLETIVSPPSVPSAPPAEIVQAFAMISAYMAKAAPQAPSGG